VDAALTEARKSLFGQGRGLEWGTPVLYLRAPNGRIFDVQRDSESDKQRAAQARQQVQPVAPPVALQPAQPEPQVQPEPQAQTPPQPQAQSQPQAKTEEKARTEPEVVSGPSVQRGAQVQPQTQPPAEPDTRERVQALYNQAQAAVASENWGGALQLWQAVLALEPNNPQARGGFEYAQKQGQLSAAFEDGKKHYNAGRLQQAIDAFNWVRTTAGSNYKGVDGYIAQAQSAIAARQARPANPPAHPTGPQSTVPPSQPANQPATQPAHAPTNQAASTPASPTPSPQYNTQAATPATPAKQGGMSTMMIVVIAVIATIVVGFLACAMLGLMMNGSSYSY
jgi:hypothetical protein